MENVLFKISFPAEFHAQTAAEAGMTLHTRLGQAGKSVENIREITIRTHEAAIRIIDKKGPLNNPADHDHCIQYMIAVPLIFGRLTAADYEDAVAQDPRIDVLRAKMTFVEDPQYTKDYHDSEKGLIANALTVEFDDSSTLDEIAVKYPIGHKRRPTRALRCSSRSSGRTSRTVFRRSSNRRSSRYRWIRQSWKRCRSMTSICT